MLIRFNYETSVYSNHSHSNLYKIVTVLVAMPLEDRSLLRIVLVKSHREASNCWKSLLEGQYEVGPWELDQMEKKLTLERFQTEVCGNLMLQSLNCCCAQNPGFDFSSADITGNYHGGGPTLK
jgi:hypothetical protein